MFLISSSLVPIFHDYNQLLFFLFLCPVLQLFCGTEKGFCMCFYFWEMDSLPLGLAIAGLPQGCYVLRNAASGVLSRKLHFLMRISLVTGMRNVSLSSKTYWPQQVGCGANKWTFQPNSYYRNLHITSALLASLFCISIIYWNTGCCCLRFPASKEFWGFSVLSCWFSIYFCKIQLSWESVREGFCKSPEWFTERIACVTKDWSSFRKSRCLRELSVLPGSTQNVMSLLQ